MIERILQLIQEKGITAYKLTSDLGISSSKVTQWKQGLQKPGLETIVKLADYFGVTTDYLLKGDEPQAQSSKNEWRRVALKRQRNIVTDKLVVEGLSDIIKWLDEKWITGLDDFLERVGISHERFETLRKMSDSDNLDNFDESEIPTYSEIEPMRRLLIGCGPKTHMLYYALIDEGNVPPPPPATIAATHALVESYMELSERGRSSVMDFVYEKVREEERTSKKMG
ncbi:MAG: helix-turn-helix domain-containing protein [Defluviitaleaceae bacterium]|nr:helix-turn-helix domain-containing protein [Defluviitaleaceae bacterium]